MKRLAAVGFAFTILGVTACKPSAGGSCNENATVCNSPTLRMACVSGHYSPETCKGPNGCKEENGTTTCDSAHADVGDPCAQENTPVCSVDGKARLRCEDKKLVFVSWCGLDGCTVDDKSAAHCSKPFARVGDTCKSKGPTDIKSWACSEDFASELACKDGKYVQSHICRGDGKCEPLTSGPVCDRSTGAVGDDCDEKDKELAVACDAPHDNFLVCKGGKLAAGPRCGGQNKCSVAHYGIDGRGHFQAMCDQTSGKAFEDCVKEGAPACSDDGKDRLMCSMGKFVLDKACKKGCEIQSASGNKFQCKEDEPPPAKK